MHDETDVILSLQRHVARALPDWTEILTEVEQEAPRRPFATVSADGDMAPTTVGTLTVNVLPVTVHGYVQGDTRKDARKAAEDARAALREAFAVGYDGMKAGLVPLFDYTGMPAVQRLDPRAGSGDWTLALGDAESPPIPRAAQPGQVAAALGALPALALGRLLVWGKVGGPFDVRFDGELRGQSIAELVGSPSVEVEVLRQGSPDPWRTGRDFVCVSGLQLGGHRDVTDPTLRTVTAGMRATWGKTYEAPPAAHYTGVTAERA